MSKKTDYSGYVYIFPILILISIFYIIPIFMSFFYSFQKFNVIQPPEFLGLFNYKRLSSDPVFLASLKNTLVYTAIVVPVQTVLSMLLAVLITSRKRNIWTNFVRNSLFVPVITSMILVGIIWRVVLNPNMGLLNHALSSIGITKINWLGSNATAMISVCMAAVWKNVGYFMVLYIAAIMDIPKSYYEAAMVDGASATQKFFNITLPMLKPATYFVVVLGTIWSFQVFDLVYTLTGGGPGVATVTLVMSIYNSAFREYNMGYAAAISYVLFAISVIISVIQTKCLKDNESIY